MTISEWVEVNYAKLRSYAIYRCYGQVEQAEDLLQELLMMVLDGRIRVDLEKAPLTYLQQAMLSLRTRILHGPTKVRQVEGEKVTWKSQFVLMGDEWLAMQVEQPHEESFDFYPWFARLPMRLQPVMELHLEGVPYRKIALRLGRPPDTVKSQIQQGVKRLQALVRGANDESGDQGRVEDGR